MPRTRALLAVAGIAATAVLAAVPGSARAAHDPQAAADSGHAVPGRTGEAARRAAGAAGEHFGQLRGGAKPLAAGSVHWSWGIFPKTTPALGVMATQSINPNLKLSSTGNDFLYTPTLMPGGTQCIEVTTIYDNGKVQVGAWNWCASSPSFEKVAAADSTFMSTYTTTVHHLPAYTIRNVQTDAATNTWTASLYNQKTKAWDTFFTSHGTSQRAGMDKGWDMWEIYANTDPSTGNAYYCSEAKGTTFESSNLQVSFTAGVWQSASSDTTEFLPSTNPSGAAYLCPSLVFQPTASDDFSVTVPKAAPAWPTVQNGNTGNRVKTVQWLLNAQANAGLTADGNFGARTLAAVKAFQSAHSLSADGIVGPNSWKALILAVQQGATGDAVRAVQNELTAHSVSTTANGTYDATTTDHVQQFQVNSGIAPTGKVDTASWQFLVQ
jgi:hypothetical protein